MISSSSSDAGIGKDFPNRINPEYNLTYGNRYRIEIVDNSCGTPPIHKDYIYSVQPATHPIEIFTVEEYPSVLDGTVGFKIFAPAFTSLDSTLKRTRWTIERTDGMTSYTYNQIHPFSIGEAANGHIINFPYVVEFDYASGPVRQVFDDLPPGEYRITGLDLECGKTGTTTINLTNPTTYDPEITSTATSCGANTITYDLNVINLFIRTNREYYSAYKKFCWKSGLYNTNQSVSDSRRWLVY